VSDARPLVRCFVGATEYTLGSPVAPRAFNHYYNLESAGAIGGSTSGVAAPATTPFRSDVYLPDVQTVAVIHHADTRIVAGATVWCSIGAVDPYTGLLRLDPRRVEYDEALQVQMSRAVTLMADA
jgi:hypothetical protein